jgi:hypothetical protein
VQRATKDARKEEKQAMQDKVWQLHLSCLSQRQITDATGTPQKTVTDWLSDFGNSAIFAQPPSRTDAQPWGSIQQGQHLRARWQMSTRVDI